MERRLNRNLSSESRGGSSAIRLEKKIAETKRQNRPEQVPDLTDFMNDMFFGTIGGTEKKSYNLTGGLVDDDDDKEEDDFESSVNSRLSNEWLEEAKRIVASSPSRCDSPSRLVGSPRFASAHQRTLSSASNLDRRDPLSRSARRHRSVEGFSGEILSKSSAAHIRNNSHSEPFHHHQQQQQQPTTTPAEISPASAVQKWFSNILKPPNPTPPPHPSEPTLTSNQTAPTLPPRQSTHRKSRFQTNNTTHPHSIPPQPANKRTFKSTPPLTTPTTPSHPKDTHILSPPKHLHPSAHRRSISSSTCSFPDVNDHVLSPPRNLVVSARRRSVSSSTCSTGRIFQNPGLNEQSRDEEIRVRDLNVFLREQRVKVAKILSSEVDGTAKIVLSGPSNGTSSMVAAICYAWLLEYRMSNDEGGDGGGCGGVVVVPVISTTREKMWKQRQAAWLFHHVGVDATALLFSDEVELETLTMSKQLSILVVGQDILRTNDEVGSLCSTLTDNYCEHAYGLLQIPVLKQLLLAGILLDTQNLDISAKLSMTRDTDAVQLLSLGSAPNYSNSLYDQLMQDHRDGTFIEALRHNYGKPPNESTQNTGAQGEHVVSERKPYHESIIQNSDKNSNDIKNARAQTVSPKSAKPKSPAFKAPVAAPAQATDASRGKNKFFLAKWFGFGK